MADGATRVRVAVPSEAPGGLDARRSGHFGRCDCFTVVELRDGEVADVTVVQTPPHHEGGCLQPVMLLAEHMVDAIVVDGIGGRPLAGFAQVGIAVHRGTGSDVRSAVEAFRRGELEPVGPEGVCHH